MRPRDAVALAVLAALWGGSFLFMRVAVPEFGPVALIEVRVLVAAAVLVPVAAWRGSLRTFRVHLRPLAVLGALNSALPFVLLAFATVSATAGAVAILNTSAPFFAAVIAALWLGERFTTRRALGLVLGSAGVAILVGDRASFEAGTIWLPASAALAAGLCYGVAANYTRARLSGVDTLGVAAGSQVAAAALLAPFALATLPDALPSTRAWLAVAALGVVSTAIAYLLYFRLIARIGPVRAIAVTFLIPAFGMLWGAAVLGEPVTVRMLTGTAVILAGMALASGWTPGRRAATGQG